jgi:hypothetical protein
MMMDIGSGFSIGFGFFVLGISIGFAIGWLRGDKHGRECERSAYNLGKKFSRTTVEIEFRPVNVSNTISTLGEIQKAVKKTSETLEQNEAVMSKLHPRSDP